MNNTGNSKDSASILPEQYPTKCLYLHNFYCTKTLLLKTAAYAAEMPLIYNVCTCI